MPHLRRNLASLDSWDPVLLWYGRAVIHMQGRPLDDPTSWRWQAAVHGFHGGLVEPGDTVPDAATVGAFWNQCQHGSWYFLPWHRGYLAAFEQIVRAAVAELGGPQDWALPYWDMREPAWQRIRPEFCTPTLPDGERNGLYTTRRRAGFETGNIGIDPRSVALDRILTEPLFGGSGRGGGTGFGGPETDFFHGPGANGALEGGIHNYVHGRVGGPGGFMSSFEEAGLDPLFWCHHCNIDRLWEVWRTRDAGHADPNQPLWRTGPRNKRFQVYRANGEVWPFTSEQMIDTQAPLLDYRYEDISDPLGGAAPPSHLQRFARARARPASGGMGMVGRRRLSVLGATTPGVVLGAGRVSAAIPVRAARATSGMRGLVGTDRAARILLNLENITGVDRGQAYRVYVNLPDDGDPETEERHYVGTLSLFGIDAASEPDGEHGGNGLSYVFDITELAADTPAIDGAPAVTVDFVAEEDETREAAASVGRISIVREAG